MDRPLFIVGCGRSGTTVVYETLCQHRELAWFSSYTDRWPSFPQLAVLNRLRRPNALRRSQLRLLPSPREGHHAWDACGPVDAAIRNRPLTEADVDERDRRRARNLVTQHLRYQGARRFINKNTRNTRRVRYLDAIFPDALFVHVIRDPRAVAASLLAVDFWAELPLWWMEGRTPRQLESDEGWRPVTIAAHHWAASVSRLLEDKERIESDRYLEIHYESFTADPAAVVGELCRFAQLGEDPALEEYVHTAPIASQNAKFRSAFDEDDLATIRHIVADVAERVGYPSDGEGRGDPVRGPARAPQA